MQKGWVSQHAWPRAVFSKAHSAHRARRAAHKSSLPLAWLRCEADDFTSLLLNDELSCWVSEIQTDCLCTRVSTLRALFYILRSARVCCLSLVIMTSSRLCAAAGVRKPQRCVIIFSLWTCNLFKNCACRDLSLARNVRRAYIWCTQKKTAGRQQSVRGIICASNSPV